MRRKTGERGRGRERERERERETPVIMACFSGRKTAEGKTSYELSRKLETDDEKKQNK